MASHGSKVVIISSSIEKVDHALARLHESYPENKNIEGHAVSVTDTERFVDLLRRLAPIDHLVYSAVDFLIRGPPEDIDLSRAKEGFDIKFWGAVTTAHGAFQGFFLMKPSQSTILLHQVEVSH